MSSAFRSGATRLGGGAVSTESYGFKLGDFECLSVMDGSVNYPLGHLFASVPRAQIEEALGRRNLPLEYITTAYAHLYVNTGEHEVLVDMGAGKVTPSTGRLRQPEPTLEVTLNTAQNTPCFLEVTWKLRVQPALDELAARGWLNPSQIGSVCPSVAPCVDSVQTTVITPATCPELRLDQADAET